MVCCGQGLIEHDREPTKDKLYSHIDTASYHFSYQDDQLHTSDHPACYDESPDYVQHFGHDDLCGSKPASKLRNSLELQQLLQSIQRRLLRCNNIQVWHFSRPISHLEYCRQLWYDSQILLYLSLGYNH
jgi:hypothetical protein